MWVTRLNSTLETFATIGEMPPNKATQDRRFCGEGLATVMMIEQHPRDVLQLAHGTSLIRVAQAHLQRKLNSLYKEHSKHYIKSEDVESLSAPTLPSPTRGDERRLTQRMRPMTWLTGLPKVHHQLKRIHGKSQTWVRIHRTPRQTLYCPTAQDMAPIHMFTAQRITEPHTD